MNTYNIRLPMISAMMGLFLTVGLIAQTSQVQPIMTNATVEAMVRGGVPLETTIQAIKTAQQTDFTIDNKTRGQLTKAGASDSASAQILEAMHQRVIHSVTGSASSPEDKLYGGIRISGQTPSEGDQPRIDSTQMARPPVRVAVPTPVPVVPVPVLASTPAPTLTPTAVSASTLPPALPAIPMAAPALPTVASMRSANKPVVDLTGGKHWGTGKITQQIDEIATGYRFLRLETDTEIYDMMGRYYLFTSKTVKLFPEATPLRFWWSWLGFQHKGRHVCIEYPEDKKMKCFYCWRSTVRIPGDADQHSGLMMIAIPR